MVDEDDVRFVFLEAITIRKLRDSWNFMQWFMKKYYKKNTYIYHDR